MQPEFNFDSAAAVSEGDAVSRWREQRREEQIALARSLGLPIGREAEVWLKGGIRLRGRLELQEEMLLRTSATPENTKLLIGGTPFDYSQMESCVRVDF
jgi:hypothetical protein